MPVLIMRRSKVAGVYVPLDDGDLNLELRRDMQLALARKIRASLRALTNRTSLTTSKPPEKLAVDANPILSAVIGGSALKGFWDPRNHHSLHFKGGPGVYP